jgi:hypothetical protein
MEATMRKFFLITVVLSSATTAHAGLYVIVADADVRAPVANPADRAVVGAASRRQRSQQNAENDNGKTDDDTEADGNAERNAATPDTHAPPFRTSQIQTKDSLRVWLVAPKTTRGTFGARFSRGDMWAGSHKRREGWAI